MDAFIPTHTIGQERVDLSVRQPVRGEELRDIVDVPPHDHSYYEVCIVWCGHARHITGEGCKALHAGSVVVIPPGGVHAFSECAGLRLTNLYYLSEWLLLDLPLLWREGGLVPLFLSASLFPHASLSAPASFHLLDEERGRVRGEVEALYDELSRPVPSPLFTRASLLKLLVLLSRAWARTSGGTPAVSFRKEVWVVLDAVETALTRGADVPVTATSRALGMSPDHLSRLFKEATGSSVEPYFQHRRVQRACAMLLSPGTSVTEVAYALGYADASHMSRRFKKHTGISPSAYRRKFNV